MRVLSLFSGIGAPEQAWRELGWEHVGCAEVEPFPCAVLEARFPGVPNLGDVNASNFIARARALRPDLIVAGAPCQAFSVAGLRRGLQDARGNLTLRTVEIVDALDPTWLLFENVPGILSSRDNAWGCFLGALVGADAPLVPGRGQRWTDAGLVDGPRRTAAWRILDAQYFGVPQRRRRTFLLAVRGTGNWDCARALFPLANGLCGHPAPSREAREGTAEGAGCGTESGGRQVVAGGGSSKTLSVAPALTHHGGRFDFDTEAFVAGIAGTIRAHHGNPQAEHAWTEQLVTHSLRAEGFDASEDGTGRGNPIVAQAMTVRRLTPRECERLQAFPDHFTRIPWRGHPATECPDGPRYKALGNSMAVVVMRWLGQRIQLVESMGIR